MTHFTVEYAITVDYGDSAHNMIVMCTVTVIPTRGYAPVTAIVLLSGNNQGSTPPRLQRDAIAVIVVRSPHTERR